MSTELPLQEVQSVIDKVRNDGDSALRILASERDGVVLDSIAVPLIEAEAALRELDPLGREALEEMAEAVLAFHRTTRPEPSTFDREGLDVRSFWKPVERAGCYVPGGKVCYPSSLIMAAAPARVAGVDRIAVFVAPDADGRVPGPLLAAAAIAQVDEIYAISGPQAIAAMALGTETVEAVDVIVGSGDCRVAAAKRLLADVVGIPVSFAGPSEVVVIADATTPPELAAIDLLAQAEHGPGGLAWLVTWSDEVAESVENSLSILTNRSSQREQLEHTLGAGGRIALVDDASAAMDLVNAIAPEQLEVATVDPEALIPHIVNAGAVFAGINCPAVLADYMAGPSHIVPAGGASRFASALDVRDFMRHHHVVSASENALLRVAPHVAAIAEMEDLESHGRSIQMRTQS